MDVLDKKQNVAILVDCVETSPPSTIDDVKLDSVDGTSKSSVCQETYLTSVCRQKRKDRMRMRQWLVEQVETDLIDGLRWLNSEKTLLRIPWKHGSRNGWSLKDGLLFERWAHHTGKSLTEFPVRLGTPYG